MREVGITRSSLIESSYERLLDRIVECNLSGWDPYDGLNTDYGIIRKNRITRLFFQYFNKFSPYNFRPILGIRRSRQHQAEAFVGLALMRVSGNRAKHAMLLAIIDELKRSSLKEEYGYHCWDAHGFPIQMRTGFTPVGTTDVVGNEACGRLLHEYYIEKNDQTAREMSESVADYMLEMLLVDNGDYSFFRYKPISPKWSCTYNASLLAATYVLDIFNRDSPGRYDDVLRRCFEFVCSKQQSRGYWNYSIDLRSGIEKPQVDFHQGFILDCLLRYMERFGFQEPFLSTYKKGLKFYYENQFLRDGQGIYRWPKKWPVNIQNQAQGILTFTRASLIDSKYLEFAQTIAEWTIRNMQDADGHFYYLKYPFFTNKIPYIRWSDAGMAYGLAVFLNIEKKSVSASSQVSENS